MSLTVTILGCGSSSGVPRPALGWGACDPNNPKNRRRRCSVLLERKAAAGITRVLIDTSPDLREQLIDANVDHLDAVFLTHEHADQVHGMDDLRSRGDAHAPAHSGLHEPVDLARCHDPLRLLLHAGAGQRLSADPGAPAYRGRRGADDRREGRSPHPKTVSGRARPHSGARLSHRQRRLLAGHERHSAREPQAAARSRRLDHRRACAIRRIRHIRTSIRP